MSSHNNAPLKILFTASEAHPLIKTGGLADVAGSLPIALSNFGLDVRLVLPAYPDAIQRSAPLQEVTSIRVPGFTETIRILEGRLAGRIPLYLVDAPSLFNRPGNPYTDASGKNWSDNGLRFISFCRAVASIALNHAELGWRPDLVHCNDWQTGLVPALLSSEWNRPATLFTIHNLAYQGLYDEETFQSLRLPPEFWNPAALEFHGHCSFIKGGLAFADWVTTVSPTYALEILTKAFGYGLEGLLQHRASRLKGVLNGIDYAIWNPASDPAIPQHFDTNSFNLKYINKVRLQQELGLPVKEGAFLFGHIGRLVEQKGVDLILDVLPGLIRTPNTQLVILGSGSPELEKALHQASKQHPDRVAVFIGYDEQLAHRIEAASDCFLMPSRFEPCGLNQLYSLRYGAVPIVHRTGGLNDTVIDVSPRNLLDGIATGFTFDTPDKNSLWRAVERAIQFKNRPGVWWDNLAINGMKQNFSWDTSARHYLDIYQEAIDSPAPNPIADITERI
ncbi:MAG: glycogen synthase GlgA [Gammaproteobacteria bacterium]|nr:glycogen synthase GlgA [Gammaproteobacteria bacterium]